MNYEAFTAYQKEQRRQKIRSRIILAATAFAMLACWLVCGGSLSPSEKRLYDTVVRSHEILWQWEASLGINPDAETDPYKTGLIGVEWSEFSTTLGALEAKRTACDPRWAVAASRWFDELGIKRGDRVVVLSSSSFPGMILNVLTALEARGANVFMILSLGSSTWGANDPRAPWPVMASQLRKAGLLHTRPSYITLGGGGENGGGLSEEAVRAMSALAQSEGTPLVIKESLEDIIEWKIELIKQISPKAVVNIGGGHSSLGSGDSSVSFSPGVHTRPDARAGNGVMAGALEAGFPVIHILNIKELCAQTKIPFDAAPAPFMRGRYSIAAAVIGLITFALALIISERWHMMQ